MGTVIDLAGRRRRRAPAARQHRVSFYFDLADPGTYLAAERVERLAAPVTWQPATSRMAPDPLPQAVAVRAAALRIPLVWPDDRGAPVPRAMRAAAHAAERGRGAAFALAASRLAFCGGFDLEDPEVLAEAAAAASVGLRASLRAAGDPRRDEAIERAGRFLHAHGADAMPVLQVGRTLFAGEHRLPEATAALRGGALARYG